MSEQPYRLVRDALGFYSQVPVAPPEETPIAVEPDLPAAKPAADSAAPPPVEPVVPSSTKLLPKRRGRRPNVNADFEVDA